MDVAHVFKILKSKYGRQGWWPIVNEDSLRSEYGLGAPGSDSDRFEIIIGSILTQGVAWKNVEKALASLKTAKLLNPVKMKKTDISVIAGFIKSSGYYNQKAIKIMNFLDWFEGFSFSFERIGALKTPVLRNELLSIRGVGPETADSILLYAMERKIFVVDAYTRRVFSRLGLIPESYSYDAIQDYFCKNYRSTARNYNEYHALIVAHGKDICKTVPLCGECCLSKACSFPGRKK